MQVLLLRLNSQKDNAVLSCSLRKLLGKLVCTQSALDELKRNMTVGTELKWQWLDDKGDENFLSLSFFFQCSSLEHFLIVADDQPLQTWSLMLPHG